MSTTSESTKIASPTIHMTIWITISVFIVAIVMACIFEVEVVARGQGKVVPIGKVQTVQSEFSGKIIKIHIQNGSIVHEGDIVIELDATEAEAELNKITDEVARIKIERARLSDLSRIAKEEGLPVGFTALQMAVFDESLDIKHRYYEEQQRLLIAEAEDLQTAIAHIAGRMDVNEKSINVIEANINRVDALLEIQQERMTAANELWKKGATTRMEFLNVLDSTISLEKEREIYLQELEQKRSQGFTLKSERRRIITEQRNQILRRTSEIEARLSILDEQYRTAHRRKKSSILVAPKTGVVERLKVFTIGEIAKPGEDLLHIIPKEQNIVIEGLFTNADIGFIEIGQEVNINLDAYPSSRFGFVKGVVTQVAADSTMGASGTWFFDVHIMPHEHVLRSGDYIFSIRAGMTATLDITTDKRRIITYFFAPIIETIQSAMGER